MAHRETGVRRTLFPKTRDKGNRWLIQNMACYPPEKQGGMHGPGAINLAKNQRNLAFETYSGLVQSSDSGSLQNLQQHGWGLFTAGEGSRDRLAAAGNQRRGTVSKAVSGAQTGAGKSSPITRLGGGAQRTTPERGHITAGVDGIFGGASGRLPIFPVLRVLPALEKSAG